MNLRETVKKQASSEVKAYCLYDHFYLGIKTSVLARMYVRSSKTIKNWIKKWLHERTTDRKSSTNKVYRKFGPEKRAWLVNLYNTRPVLYHKEAARMYLEHFQETISVSAVSTILHQEGFTWKTLERRALQIHENDIYRFYHELKAVPWRLDQLVFLDEVSFDNRCMMRKKGYARKGKRLVYRGVFQRTARVSLLCFLGIDGMVDAFNTEGTFDRHTFSKFCREFALEKCEKYPGKNSIWIMDGAAIHCDANLIVYLRSIGIIPIFLPAYCPQLNPIEVVFGMIKRYLQEIYNETAKENTDFLIAKAIQHYSSFNMRNLYKKCGYLYNGHFDPAIGFGQKLEDFGFDQQFQ